MIQKHLFGSVHRFIGEQVEVSWLKGSVTAEDGARANTRLLLWELGSICLLQTFNVLLRVTKMMFWEKGNRNKSAKLFTAPPLPKEMDLSESNSNPVARIKCKQLTFLQTADTSKHDVSRSHYMFISWLSHQDVEKMELELFQPTRLQVESQQWIFLRTPGDILF